MPRPRINYKIGYLIKVHYFRPVGIGRSLDIIELALEEAEALRLKHLEELDQVVAAKYMGVSQSTFQRILSSAHRKVADALISGKAIQIRDL